MGAHYGTTSGEPIPPEYLVGHIREALSRDPRARELGVEVQVAGAQVVLTGTVATAAQRDAIRAVVCELVDGEAPAGTHVVNDLDVVDHQEDGHVERVT